MTTQLTIRAAAGPDMAEIDALLARSYPALLKDHYPPSLLVTAVPIISRAQPRLIASGTYFVVVDRNKIVGAGGWTGERSVHGIASAADGHIRHVVTDHRQVRRGIGRALIRHIVSDARTSGVRRLECLSTLMAVPFYAACGFTTLGELRVALRPGIEFPVVRMALQL